ncbi:embryonic stem cell-specific 5-hydroxymethylcytosine-binding protein [Ctenocephalides felis]|uniref:embryonic stem cell-specific 5-hydroxymethylcytosine-binding protein n=1 Tax=Ctenocephalides felis TaxID=7515 RepID=UPI000E6E4678|nr:embryonic stem cell-specific 5-hydroxymethylcytosine-binding protein [Ctenocephalides felis]
MCGRTATSLCAEDVCSACTYHDKTTSTLKKPEWRHEHNFGKTYAPSTNLAPTDISPVLISASHYGEEDGNSRIIVPMMWGMIPPWHKGDYKTHGLTTNNCRLESMLQSKLYGPAFRNGQRCVVLADGFYEWQTEGDKSKLKTPYYIYLPQDKESTNSWSGVNLLKLAGLFNVWSDQNGDKMYSYSIITLESNDTLSWLHHRMPVIFDNDKDVETWLNYKKFSKNEALAVLKPCCKLKWHEVDPMVNNSRNKSDKCNKPVDKSKSKKSSFMDNWLQGASKKRTSEGGDGLDKKVKLEK